MNKKIITNKNCECVSKNYYNRDKMLLNNEGYYFICYSYITTLSYSFKFK